MDKMKVKTKIKLINVLIIRCIKCFGFSKNSLMIKKNKTSCSQSAHSPRFCPEAIKINLGAVSLCVVPSEKHYARFTQPEQLELTHRLSITGGLALGFSLAEETGFRSAGAFHHLS